MLTGMNIDDFGIGEYPYKTVLKEKTCESLAYDLKPYGYKSFAIHDHEDVYKRQDQFPSGHHASERIGGCEIPEPGHNGRLDGAL